MTPSHSARQHLDALTGLRFVAAFSIFLHHYFGRFNTRSIFHDFMLESGVAFFFVLSGFILVYVYARDRNVLHLAGYLRRRFFRIYPLYAVTMLLVFVTRPNAIPDWPEGIIEIILVATMTQSWTGIWELATLFNGPAWSISTEFGFYLLFPILLRFYGSLGWVVLGLFIAKPVIQIVTLGTPLEAWAYSAHLAHPLFRLDQFALGMWVGQIFLKHRSTRAHALNRRARDIRATLAETATVILAVAFAFIPLSRPLSAALGTAWEGLSVELLHRDVGAITFAVLILTFAGQRGFLSRLAGSRPMVFLGEISFSFYLVHVIVFNYVEARWRMLSGLTPTELFVLVLLLTLSASTLLFYLVETPFRRLGQTPLRVCLGDAGRALRGMPVLVSALILIAGGSFFVGIPKRPHLSEDHLFPLRTLPLDIEQTVDDIALSEARLHLSDSGLCLDMAWDFEDVSAGHAQNRFLLVSRAGVPRLRVRPRTIIGSNNQASQVAVVDRICLGRDFRPNRDLLDAEDDTIAPLRFDFRITGRAVPNQRVAFILDPASLTLVQVPPS